MTERNLGEPIRTIRLGEEIFPFADPKYVQVETGLPDEFHKTEHTSYSTEFELDIGLVNFKPLRVEVSSWAVETDGTEVALFIAEVGYVVTEDDLDLEKRRMKLLHSYRQEEAHCLSIGFSPKDLASAGLASSDDGLEFRFSDKQEVVVRALSCIVSADRTYISRGEPELPVFVSEYYGFCDFFPVETGPLAADSWATCFMEDSERGAELDIGEGHHLKLTGSMDTLSRIGIRFVIDPVKFQGFEFGEFNSEK